MGLTMFYFNSLFVFFTALVSLEIGKDRHTYTIKGEIDISSSNETFYARYEISGFHDGETPVFLLNDELDVVEVKLNGLSTESRVTSTHCTHCLKYKVGNRSLKKDDIVEIVVELRKQETSDKLRYDNKKTIAFKNNVFRASEDAHWVPNIIADEATEHFYIYDLKIEDDPNSTIYLDGKIPYSNSAHFVSDKPQKPVLLVSGDLSYFTDDNFLVINLEKQHKGNFLGKAERILKYYTTLLQRETNEKFSFIFLKTDNPYWGGFVSGESIIFFKSNNIESTLAHELAHFYSSRNTNPTGSFYWLIMESLPEYLALKYSINNNNSEHIQERYQILRQTTPTNGIFSSLFKPRDENEFVRLDRVRKQNDIGPRSRYNVVPFQLLAIEKIIGEEKMLNFIKIISTSKYKGKDGYSLFLFALKQSGVNDIEIKEIENKIVKRFELSEYGFIESYLRGV